jgi:hypothetical protein
VIKTDGIPTIAWAPFKQFGREEQTTTDFDSDPIVEIDCAHWFRGWMDLGAYVDVPHSTTKKREGGT